MIDYVLLAFLAAQGPLAQVQADTRAQTEAQQAQQAQQNAAAQKSAKDFKNPINITADRFEIQARRNEATWSGNVRAQRGRTQLTCERLVAYYTAAQEIRRIECVGRVEASHGDIWAAGERAEFDNQTGNLVVTGNPQARQGNNHLKGARIIVNVTRDTIAVEQAQTVIESTPTQGIPGLPRPPASGGGTKK